MRTQLNTKNDPLKDIMNPFTLDEAVSLIYRLAVLKKDVLHNQERNTVSRKSVISAVY